MRGIFTQINRGDHAKRRHQHRHDHHHQHRAEYGREDAALGIGLARIGGEEFPELGQIKAGLVEHAHRVGPVGAHHLAKADGQLLAGGGAGRKRGLIERVIERFQFRGQPVIFKLQLFAPLVQRSHVLGRFGAVQFKAAFLQPQALHLIVDRADPVLFDMLYFPVNLVIGGQRLLESGKQPGGIADLFTV